MNDTIKNIMSIFPESPTDKLNFIEWTSDEYEDMDCFYKKERRIRNIRSLAELEAVKSGNYNFAGIGLKEN